MQGALLLESLFLYQNKTNLTQDEESTKVNQWAWKSEFGEFSSICVLDFYEKRERCVYFGLIFLIGIIFS